LHAGDQLFRCTKPITLNDIANSPVKKLIAGMQYVFFEAGPLTSRRASAPAPISRAADPRLGPGPTSSQFSAGAATATAPACARTHFPLCTISAVHLRPEARGEVRLKRRRPAGGAVDPFQLSEEPVRICKR